MAVAVAQLIAPQAMTAATETYYTSAGGTRIDKVTICNTGAAALTVTLFIVPNGQAAFTSNTLSSARSIAAGQTWNCPDLIGQALNKGDTIQGSASGAGLTIMASGVTIS